MLTKDQLLAAGSQSKAVTTISTSIGEIGIRIMTGTEREIYETQIFKDGKVDREYLRAKLLAKVLCDADGVRLFTDADIAAVSDLPAPVVLQLFDAAQKVNALTREDLDEMTKKS